ncbi:MAG: DUF4167 domain-containing protein [Rhodospirillales bacterium]
MKHGQNSRRGRSRGNGKRNTSSRNQTFDSNGPEGKVRGTPQQIHDKYLSLARDAASAGEHIAAEGFFQFAEHYFRILNADQQNRQRMEQQQQEAQDEIDNAADNDDGNAQSNAEPNTQSGGETVASSDSERGRRGRGNGRRRNAGGREQASEENASTATQDSSGEDQPATEVAQEGGAVGTDSSDSAVSA